jgi:hypothetical protein
MTEKQSKGIAVEIEVKDVKIDEFGRGPHLADGMNLCAGCEDVFTLGKYCGFCQAIHEELQLRETKRFAVDRIDNGTVEFEEPEVERPASAWTVGVIFFGALCSAMLTMTVLWFGFHGLIAFCLKHGK